MLRYICLFFILLGVFDIPLWGQNDSVLVIQNMEEADIVFHEQSIFNQKIISASKSLKEVIDLPFTIHVITKEEIIQNGYVTLVDALKMVPGIRISQPGSAFEGETFLMRGLKGNAYTKILINGINIKPAVVSGMPIGAQFPIQQAERIEIIYGPVAALYGADASAGVINIILKKTERPIFAKAGLHLGDESYRSLNLIFGGKFGKGKNTLDFSVYANNTSYDNRKIFHTGDPQLFNPLNKDYSSGFSLDLSPNYTNSGIDSLAFIGKLPHLSRTVGIQLGFKSLELSINTMYRRDHSAIGLNPAAVSYANSLDFIGERLLNLNLAFDKQYKKWGFKSELNYLDFEMDNRSSTTPVLNTFTIGLALLNFFNATTPNGDLDADKFLSQLDSSFDTYIKGNRYSYAQSQNLRIAQTFDFYPSDFFEVAGGLTVNTYNNIPLTEYSPIPLNELVPGQISIDSTYAFFNVPFIPESSIDFEISSYVQSHITLEKWNIIAGAQYFNSISGNAFNPRVAILYHLLPSLRLRGFYGTAFRRPPQFFETNNYQFLENTPVSRFSQALSPERTTSFEFGCRWTPKEKIYTDVVFFHTSTENLLFYQAKVGETSNGLFNVELSYDNFSDANSILYGVQSSLKFRNLVERLKLNLDLHLQITKIQETNIVLNSSDDFQGNVNEQPRFMFQSRTSFSPLNALTFTFDGIYMRNFRNKGLGDRKVDARSYFTLDVLTHFKVSRNFSMFLKINNLFNKEYAGIDAYGTVDDLAYNPQQKRFLRLGMNYTLD